MDPDACLRDLITDIELTDYPGAASLAADLLEWLGNKGFEPTWPENWTHIELDGLGCLDYILGEIQWSSDEYTAAQMDTDVANLRALHTWLASQPDWN